MATVTSNFQTLTAIDQAAATMEDSSLSVTSAITWGQSAYDSANYYDVYSYSAIASTHVAGTLTNGDVFSAYGTNLTGYPYTITRLEYSFAGYGFDVSIYGAVSQSGAYSAQTGYINKIVVSNGSANITVNGYVDVSTGDGSTISSVKFEYGDASLLVSGSFTADVWVGADYNYYSAVTGNVTAMTLTKGGYATTITGISVNIDTLDAYDTATATIAAIMSGSDSVTGTGAAEYLFGYGGADTINAGAGNDTLNGGSGADTMLGGSGNDIYLVDNAGDKVYETTVTSSSINAGGTSDLVKSSVTFNLVAYTGVSFVENLTLTGTSAINGTGNSLDNILTGNSGHNILNGGTGADTMKGGLGNDTYYVDNAGDIVTELTSQGTDMVQSAISYTLGANLERLTLTGTSSINGTGNSLANTLTGNSGNNILDGGVGTDTMSGGLGNDTYLVDNVGDIVTELAGQGADTVRSSISYTLSANQEKLTLTRTSSINGTGNTLGNTLTGNTAANILNGGAGNDTLTGGAGQDSFLFNTALNASTNKDTITDFAAIDDTIRLENAIFSKLATTGVLSSAFFRASANGAAADNNDYILYNTTNGGLSYDADGNGAGGAIQFALLGASSHPAITRADFVVV